MRASFPRPAPPTYWPHSPSLQRLQGDQGHPWVPEDPPVQGPQALPVAETSLLRDSAHATGSPRQSLSLGPWDASLCSELHPPTDSGTFSLAPSPVSTCRGNDSDKGGSTRGSGL